MYWTANFQSVKFVEFEGLVRMLKRFDRYVDRGNDGTKDDAELLEELYMPGECSVGCGCLVNSAHGCRNDAQRPRCGGGGPG